MHAGAAYALGTAASNNAEFQRTLLSACPDIFVRLARLVLGGDEEAAVKGLYAAASLIRNTDEARNAFLDSDGVDLLLRVMAADHGGQVSAADGSEQQGSTCRQLHRLTFLFGLSLRTAFAQSAERSPSFETLFRCVQAAKPHAGISSQPLHLLTTAA